MNHNLPKVDQIMLFNHCYFASVNIKRTGHHGDENSLILKVIQQLFQRANIFRRFKRGAKSQGGFTWSIGSTRTGWRRIFFSSVTDHVTVPSLFSLGGVIVGRV